MTTIELINDIMNKYYVTREIKNDVERNNTLKYNVALVQFNEAVDELINEITFESVQNIILTGFILNFFICSSKSLLTCSSTSLLYLLLSLSVVITFICAFISFSLTAASRA